MSDAPTTFFYGFEAIEATSLSLIPLSIRYRLDRCAIKLHLHQWQQLTHAERDDLLRAPFASAADEMQWAAQLTSVVQVRCNCMPDQLADTAAPIWQQLERWPAEIVDRCVQLQLPLPPLRAWQQSIAQHRHALCKIARSRHDYLHLVAAFGELLPVGDLHHDD